MALFSLLWNIWSVFIYPKPRLRIRLAVRVYKGFSPPIQPTIMLRAINLGPGRVTLRNAVIRRSRLRSFGLSDVLIAMPYADYPATQDVDPWGAPLFPVTLNVNDEFLAQFPLVTNWFSELKLSSFGFIDTFDRRHWCSWRDGKRVRDMAMKRSTRCDETNFVDFFKTAPSAEDVIMFDRSTESAD